MRESVLDYVYRTNYFVSNETERWSTGGEVDSINPARNFIGNSRPVASSAECPESPVGPLRIS